MLLRIAGHYPNNPNHIDKLIAIKGLPEEWITRPSRFGGRELVPPLVPDIEENIPHSIRHFCDPLEITKVFPPIEKGRDYVVDKLTVIGLKFDYMTEPGQVFWEKIERYLDRMTPRDQKVPEPVLVAPDHKSSFNPHRARRTVRGSLEFYTCEVPFVDLTTKLEPIEPAPVRIEPAVITPNVSTTLDEHTFQCDQCPKVFEKEKALSMHKMSGHRKIEPAGV